MLKNDCKLVWSPLYRFLESAMVLPSSTRSMSVEETQAAYAVCISFLRTRVSYCFGLPNNNNAKTWMISTWANRITRSSIEKRVTTADKALLPAATNRNHGTVTKTRKWVASKNPLYPRRQGRSKTGNTAGNAAGNTAGNIYEDNAEDQRDMVACFAGADCKFCGLVATYNTCCSKCQQHSHAVCGGRHWLGGTGGEEWLCNACHGRLKDPPPAASTGASADDSEHMQYIVWLKANFTTINNHGTRKGKCGIAGCQFPMMQLEGNGSHRCHNCEIPVHNLCAGSKDLNSDKDERIKLCSLSCKGKP
jgi:hypothetical protein